METSALFSSRGTTEDERALAPRWGWMLALGVVLFVVGLLALGAATTTTFITVFILGGVLLFGGVVELGLAFGALGWRGALSHIVVGLFMAIVGFIMLALPASGAIGITLVLALMLLGGGSARIIYALITQHAMWGWSLVGGIASVILGALVLGSWPLASLWFLGTIIGIELMVRGANWMSLGLVVHGATRDIERLSDTTAR